MTKEEAWKKDRYKYRYDDCVTEPTIAMPVYYDGFDAGHAAANQWTYLPELPKEEGEYIVTVAHNDSTEAETDYWSDEGWRYFNKRIIAWRPLPSPAEIKRSEDEV